MYLLRIEPIVGGGIKMIQEQELVTLPDYMKEPGPANHYYGTLRYNRRDNTWVIRGEPCVCQMAKRLFPGCEGKGRGVARFTANKRTIGDLNWLMLRYPLEIKDKRRWEKAISEARQHVMDRERSIKYPIKVTPSPLVFQGQLKEFQKEGLGFLLQNDRTLLADEMGLGKTVQALAFLAHTQSFPALLVVPPHLVRNWQREIHRFIRMPQKASDPSMIHIIDGLKPYSLPPAHIYIIHYLLLRGWKNQLPRMGFQALIFDEIQELRHAGTEKYSAASLLADSCEKVIGLSGTPIHNRGGEMWNVMNILDYHCLGDYDSFSREWCYGYRNRTVKDPVLLGQYLKREGLLFRRTKAQVLQELPPKRRVVQEIDSDRKLYNALMVGTMEKVRKLNELEGGLEKGRLMEQIAQEERQATGIAKAPYVCTFVKALLEGEEKVLLFAHHHKVMDIYRKELKPFKPVFITGRETEKQKDESLQAFMAGKTNICCIGLRAAAGLNLQRATCVVFGELDWSPAVHSQAEDRAHRMGQQDSILCYYLVCSKGSDQDIQEALGLKVSQFVGIMGDTSESEEDRLLAQRAATQHILRVIERLMARALEEEGHHMPLSVGNQE